MQLEYQGQRQAKVTPTCGETVQMLPGSKVGCLRPHHGSFQEKLETQILTL